MTTSQETRQIWTGSLVHVQTIVENGIETVTALLRQGPAGATTYRGLPLRATGPALAACRTLLREDREVCLLGEITDDAFEIIAPAIAAGLIPTANRRQPVRAATAVQETGRVLSLAARRTRVEDPEILAGFA